MKWKYANDLQNGNMLMICKIEICNLWNGNMLMICKIEICNLQNGNMLMICKIEICKAVIPCGKLQKPEEWIG